MLFHPEAPPRALHARAGRLARPQSLGPRLRRPFLTLIASLGLIGFGPRIGLAADPLLGPFPRLFYDDTGWLDGDLNVIRRFNVLSTAFWNCEGPNAARLDSLAQMNPDLVRLAYVNAAGRRIPAVGDPNHIVNRLAAGIQDGWLVRNELGQLVYWDPTIPDMPLINLSTRCPRIGGQTYGEFIADFAAQQILANGRFDGIMWDNIWATAAWVNEAIPGSLDLDGNHVADHPDSVDVWWTTGLNNMLARYRAQVGPNVITIANTNGHNYAHLNGRYFEAFPYREGWAASLNEVAEWQQFGRQPTVCAGVTRSTEQDFRLMRFGMTTALLGGFFSFHYAEEHTWPNPVFYDEYGVNLGQPVGEPIEIGADVVATANFETGLPAIFPGSCSDGVAQWTTQPGLVIDGVGSLYGRRGAGTAIWRPYLCSNPSALPLAANTTYTVSFRYRVVTEPPGDGYFYVGARSNQNLALSDRNLVIFDPPVGTVGEIRDDITLGPYSGYYLYFAMRNGGDIVIDSIQILRGRGGAFRRDFQHGLTLVNPNTAPITLDIEPGFRRIAGTVDPGTNNGQSATHIVLGGEDGLVLLREAAGLPEDPPALPPAPPLIFAYPNPAPMRQGDAAVVSGVPPGGSVAIVSAAGRHVRRLSNPDDEGRCAWNLVSDRGARVGPGVYLVVVRDAESKQVGSCRLTLAR